MLCFDIAAVCYESVHGEEDLEQRARQERCGHDGLKLETEESNVTPYSRCPSSNNFERPCIHFLIAHSHGLPSLAGTKTPFTDKHEPASLAEAVRLPGTTAPPSRPPFTPQSSINS